MLLDPFTIIAQLINFAILVVALRYLLYNRVIAAMDEREAKIAARITEAEERERQASDAAVEYRDTQRALEANREELMEEARADAAERRRALLGEVRADVDEQRYQWQRGLRRDQADLERELKRRSVEQILAVARGALRELADAELDQRAIDLALDRLADNGEAMQTMFGDGANEMTIVSATNVETHREHIVRRLTELGLRGDQQIRFERDPELVLGVELRANSAAVTWNAADYLDRLDGVLAELLSEYAPASDSDYADAS